MKFNEFESMIMPFINVRGWDVLYPYESLSVAIENWIQDIYNEYKWSWLVNTTKVVENEWTDWGNYYWFDLGTIKEALALEVYDTDWNFVEEFTEVKRITELTDHTFLMSEGRVIVSAAIIASITFRWDYTWNLFAYDTSTEIPMPNRMMPALYYLVLSQIDIIEVTQAESQTYSNYWKYTNKIKTLKENDIAMATYIEGWNRH